MVNDVDETAKEHTQIMVNDDDVRGESFKFAYPGLTVENCSILLFVDLFNALQCNILNAVV